MEKMSRISSKPVAEPDKQWLLTFNDMITLLLTFFVLLISMSMIEKTTMATVADSVRKVAGGRAVDDNKTGGHVLRVVPSLRDEGIERARRQKEDGFPEDVFAARRSVVTGMLQTIDGVKITPTENGLGLSMNENLLFSSGSADISDKGARILGDISRIITKADVLVRVEGHTDSIPIDSNRYPSNWELSLARATRVVRWLAENGTVNPEKLSAAGYADTHPLVSNDTERNRQANRRVDIVLTFLKL